MPVESATRILSSLAEAGADVCVGGGWGVDALLEQQTRDHSDLDLWLEVADIEPLFRGMTALGIDRILPWPGDRPWNFVLHDGGALRVDLHFYTPLGDGRLHYGAVTGDETFPDTALRGTGRISTLPVRCEDPEWSLRWHQGYPQRAFDRDDVRRLCARFDLAVPDAYR
jgi:lincosamide nucleotidyltransferase A/C/D/E